MRKRSLKICFVTEDFYPSFIGGQGVWGKELVTQLAKHGVSVTVFADRRPGRKNFWRTIKNVRLITVPFTGSIQILLAFFEYIYFVHYYRKEYFDILHANQLAGLFFVLHKPKNIARIVVTIHNTFDQMSRATASMWKKLFYRPFIVLESFVFRRADAVICHTDGQRQYMIDRYHILTSHIYTIPMGVSEAGTVTSKIKTKAKLAMTLGYSTLSPVVLFVGRLVARKRVDLLIQTMSQLPDFILIIVGEGPLRKKFEDIAPRNVKIVGRVKDTIPYYTAADIFVLLSQAEGGVSLASYEAASFGLPLVLSSDAADTAILEHQKNGYILYSEEIKKIKHAIQYTMTHRVIFGRQSSIYARVLTWKRSAFETMRVYEKVLDGAQG